MRDFHGSSRRCATCQWWEGERMADPGRLRVYTPRHAVLGSCRSPASWWVDRLRQAESTCAFWQQWGPVLGATAFRAQRGPIILGPAMDLSEYLKPDPSE